MLQLIPTDGTFGTTLTTASVEVPVLVSTSATSVDTTTVLHLINGEHFSGAERVQQLLGRHLDIHGYTAHFACLKTGKFGSLCGLAKERVHETPMTSRWDIGIVHRLINLVSETSAKILHAHTPRSAMIAAKVAKRTKLPWVYHVHSPTVRDSDRWLINSINGLVERRSLRTCDALITVSQSLRDEMQRRGADVKRMYVVPNGVECQQPITPTTRSQQRQWRIGVVALFRPRKGLEVLLQAFEMLCASTRTPADYSLEVIGGFETPNYEQAIRNQIQEMEFKNQVNLHGFVTNVSEKMREFDLLALPSLFGEGMPMVVLEAMACGIPVVATRVEGTPEVIREEMEGWLAEPGDIADLAEALRHATSSRPIWCRASSAAAKRQQEKFSDQAMSASVAAVYNTLL